MLYQKPNKKINKGNEMFGMATFLLKNQIFYRNIIWLQF